MTRHRLLPRRATRLSPVRPAASSHDRATAPHHASVAPSGGDVDVIADAGVAPDAGMSRLPIEVVDTADIPGGGTLLLLQCGEDFSIEFDEEELMGTRSFRSEQALAQLTCERLGRNDGDILIGGLGMGYTLGAALGAWGETASIVVAELIPEVIAWARGPLAHVSGLHIDDPRVSLRCADVHDVIATAQGAFDAILLDVDNGPDGFLVPENDRLYCNWGLHAAHAALRPGGILAIWSAYPDPDFAERLERAGFIVDEVEIPAFPGSKTRWHNIWFATRSGTA